ncbi:MULTISPECIES: flavin reductase family protein [unclassified Microbacterium]|uniref:flavin reductase family protein n=1 Tax=unclassified Microbacterium TaxID=2609290 RepID=UPI00097E9391|nr:flavin reductase family protein [Microbacterium sp. JB110]RCS62701.1 flavin reductase [Microbacterium sp. JB110]SJM63335.1 NADH-FMN oxidoreductase [Frigoribacterium sp. JB110]
MQSNEAELGDAFKTVFRTHPAAVTIVTASTPSGPVGLTASSVSSVAAVPPAVSFSVTRATGTAGAILEADNLSIHFLTDEHVDTALAFAVSGRERFTAEQGWTFDEHGNATLAGARATLRGRIRDSIRVSDSSLVIADIVEVCPAEIGAPLLYENRTFFRFDPNGAAL